MINKKAHVVPSPNGGWDVKEDQQRSKRHFQDREEAIEYGREICQDEGIQLVIHREDGTIEYTGCSDVGNFARSSSRSREMDEDCKNQECEEESSRRGGHSKGRGIDEECEDRECDENVGSSSRRGRGQNEDCEDVDCEEQNIGSQSRSRSRISSRGRNTGIIDESCEDCEEDYTGRKSSSSTSSRGRGIGLRDEECETCEDDTFDISSSRSRGSSNVRSKEDLENLRSRVSRVLNEGCEDEECDDEENEDMDEMDVELDEDSNIESGSVRRGSRSILDEDCRGEECEDDTNKKKKAGRAHGLNVVCEGEECDEAKVRGHVKRTVYGDEDCVGKDCEDDKNILSGRSGGKTKSRGI